MCLCAACYAATQHIHRRHVPADDVEESTSRSETARTWMATNQSTQRSWTCETIL